MAHLGTSANCLEGIAADGEHGEAGEIIQEGSIKPVSIRSGYWLHNPDVKIAERGVLRKAEEIAERAAEAERTEARHRHREKNSMDPGSMGAPTPDGRLSRSDACGSAQGVRSASARALSLGSPTKGYRGLYTKTAGHRKLAFIYLVSEWLRCKNSTSRTSMADGGSGAPNYRRFLA